MFQVDVTEFKHKRPTMQCSSAAVSSVLFCKVWNFECKEKEAALFVQLWAFLDVRQKSHVGRTVSRLLSVGLTFSWLWWSEKTSSYRQQDTDAFRSVVSSLAWFPEGEGVCWGVGHLGPAVCANGWFQHVSWLHTMIVMNLRGIISWICSSGEQSGALSSWSFLRRRPNSADRQRTWLMFVRRHKHLNHHHVDLW